MAPSRTDRQSRKAASSEKPPRPPNAWILYRTARLKQIRSYQKEGQPPLKQADISRTIGDMWKAEPDHVRKQFEKEAEIAKAKHAEQYPNYKYKPMTKEEKLKAREEAKAAKKRAQQEAKAAKASGRRVSSDRSGSSASPGQASSSSVKVEDLEPVCRGSGPSPPLDSDDEYSFPSSTPSLPSDCDMQQQPLLADHEGPIPPAYIHAPGPSYPFTFLATGLESALANGNSLSSSTPSDSPPSYTEGPSLQLPPSVPAPVPPMLGANESAGQGLVSPGGFEGLSHGSVFDMISYFMACQQYLLAPQMQADTSSFFAPFPPGAVDISPLGPPPPVDGQPAPEELVNEDDRLAPALDLAEFHDTIEDAGHTVAMVSQDVASVLDSSTTFSFEELEGFMAQHPEIAGDAMDPSISAGYHGAVAAHAYSNRLVYQQFDPPYELDPAPIPPYPTDFQGVDDVLVSSSEQSQAQAPDDAMAEWLDPDFLSLFQNQHMSQLPEGTTSSLTPTSTSDVNPTLSGEPQSFVRAIDQHLATALDPQSFSPMDDPRQLALSAQSQQLAPAVQPHSAGPQPGPQSARRYVPPGGATLPPRRRVGGRYVPRLETACQASGSGSGSA